MTKYGAYYMPGGEGMNREDFNTEEEAWEYVKSFNCKSCEEYGLESMCAAEWVVDKISTKK